MKKILMAALIGAAMPVAAQETYEIANIATQDLNGTARYVGMGGAMEALGADISTMQSNPAGIGLFRRSQVVGSFGLVSQSGESSYASANKTNVSFDQIGFVYSCRTGKSSWLNVGFNYHKSRNFDQILTVTDQLYGSSQSRLTYDKFKSGLIQDEHSLAYSQVDALYHEALYDTKLLNDDGTFNNDAYPFEGAMYDFGRGDKGYIGEYDFNISGNIHNRVYLGLTIGVHDVNYHGYTYYNESIVTDGQAAAGLTNGLVNTEMTDKRDISGTGVDVKLGAIFRPVEESPFRIGVYLNSPIFYALKSTNYTDLLLYGSMLYGSRNVASSRGTSYEYEFRTPWKFGLSVGHTIGNNIALGATYEFADYGSTDARVSDGTTYDYYWDEYYSSSHADDAMNGHIKRTLKGCSTLKLGAEFKPDPNIAIRLGYNYLSPIYKQDASRGVDVWSDGNYNSSVTDYTNWKATHRLTAGVGFQVDHFKFDLAYQYQARKGQFLPFAGDDIDPDMPNLPDDKEVSNNRHQLLFSVGYTF